MILNKVLRDLRLQIIFFCLFVFLRMKNNGLLVKYLKLLSRVIITLMVDLLVVANGTVPIHTNIFQSYFTLLLEQISMNRLQTQLCHHSAFIRIFPTCQTSSVSFEVSNKTPSRHRPGVDTDVQDVLLHRGIMNSCLSH